MLLLQMMVSKDKIACIDICGFFCRFCFLFLSVDSFLLHGDVMLCTFWTSVWTVTVCHNDIVDIRVVLRQGNSSGKWDDCRFSLVHVARFSIAKLFSVSIRLSCQMVLQATPPSLNAGSNGVWLFEEWSDCVFSMSSLGIPFENVRRMTSQPWP